MMKFLSFFLISSAVLASESSSPSNQNQTILQNLFVNNQTKIFATLLSLPDFRNVTNQLHSQNQGNLSLFAPSDQAFQNLGVSNSSMVAQNATLKVFLNDWLQYHIVPNVTYIFPSLNGSSQGNQSAIENQTMLYHQGSESARRILSTELVRFANQSMSGNQTAVSSGNATSLSSNYTQYQVLIVDPEKKQVINGNSLNPANVTEPNQLCSNGVFHVIDSVLLVPQNITQTLKQMNQTSALDSISSNSSMIVNQTSLLTFFVPNNQAISASNSTANQSSAFNLQDYLINGTAYYSPLFLAQAQNSSNSSGQNYSIPLNTTIQVSSGKNVTVSLQNNTLYFNGTRAVYSDVLVENGVMYILDGTFQGNQTANSTTVNQNVLSMRKRSRYQ